MRWNKAVPGRTTLRGGSAMKHRGLLRVPATLFALLTLLASTVSSAPLATARAAGAPVYGGTLRIAYTGAMSEFDPAQAFLDDWWVMNGTLWNGLYQFDRNGTPQLDLAAAPPVVSADRKVWTFKLRKGVLFSNGVEVTADDVAYSITRTIDPNLKPAVSWGQGYDTVFQGAQAFINGKAKSVSGIQVLDRYTIRFRLAQASPLVPSLLAMSINMVVPKAVVSKESQDAFNEHPIGTGPFILQAWKKGYQLVFVRNPHYFHPGKPYLDKILVDISVPSNLIALKVEKGEIDGFGNGTETSAADLQQARADPHLVPYLVTAPLTWVTWMDLDVHVAPLNKPALRQAIAMAINRSRLVKLLGGDAVPAEQLYVPAYPQYDTALDRKPLFAYNPQQAAALVKASGYSGQPISILYPTDYPYQVAVAPGVQQDLQQIGLNVTLRGLTANALYTVQSALTGHLASFYQWSIDYADGYDLYSGEMACSANGAGGISGAHSCDASADALVDKAQSLPLGAARDALLREAQVRVLGQAARIPLVFLKPVAMISPRVGGFYYQPMFAWQFENYWLKS
jgi:ABC-type transport system substrate-binding protein